MYVSTVCKNCMRYVLTQKGEKLFFAGLRWHLDSR